jgi:hypothetical protein
MHEAVFGNLWHEPSDEELDVCLDALLNRIESKFLLQGQALRWYEVDPSKLPDYYRGRLAWRRRKPGAVPPEPLF